MPHRIMQRWEITGNRFCRRHPLTDPKDRNPFYHRKFGYDSGSNPSRFSCTSYNRL